MTFKSPDLYTRLIGGNGKQEKGGIVEFFLKCEIEGQKRKARRKMKR